MTDIYKEERVILCKGMKGRENCRGLCVKLKNDVTDLPIWQGMCLLYDSKICRGKYMSVRRYFSGNTAELF